MRKRGVAFAAVLATVSVGLSACGSSEEGTPVGGTSESTTAPAPTSAPADAADMDDTSGEGGGERGAASQEITPPGTELKIGETATVPYTFGGSEGTIAITVTGIEKGEEADLADFGEDAEGKCENTSADDDFTTAGGVLRVVLVAGVAARAGGDGGRVRPGRVCRRSGRVDQVIAAGDSR